MKTLPDFIERDVDLSALNTLALPGRAARFARVQSPRQLATIAGMGSGRRFILGGGSNLVLGGDFDGLMLHMQIKGRELQGEDADAWYVRAAAGENWHGFVGWTLAKGWPGLENLSLIPGTVGAAPIQNIGAYGLEIADCVHEVEAFDLTLGETRRFDRAACRFGYRDSCFKQEGWHLDGHLAITSVTFRLSKRWQARNAYAELSTELLARGIRKPTPDDIATAVMAVRQRKLPDPAEIPNAGSFFQNPVVGANQAALLAAAFPSLPRYPQGDGRVKLAAGWLIEQAGWKGRSLARVAMYEKQALVLTNRGGATGAEVRALADAVRNAVLASFGVDLSPEPVFL